MTTMQKAAASLALSVFLTLVTGRPPAPADAPSDQFSALRARAIHERLLADVGPHATGSPANEIVLGRVLAELRRLGLEPEVQETFACSPVPICATVKNVVVRLPGRDPDLTKQAVLVSTHYDSVDAGPGASDAGASVAAVVEIARALRQAQSLARPVILLIDDAEELDLLGAEGFLGHPFFQDVETVVNLEARGTGGRSYWFETAPNNRGVVELVAPQLSRPATSSTFVEIYRLMPNDTDFSVWRRAGRQGVNLAFIGGGTSYHTPLDDLKSSSTASLQHQGQTGLEAVRALADREASAQAIVGAKGDAVFFDLLSRFVVRWPAAWSPWLGLLILAGLIFAVRRFGETPQRPDLLRGLAFAFSAPVAAGLAAELWRRLVEVLGALPRPWIAGAEVLQAGAWLAGLAGFILALFLVRGASVAGVWLGLWSFWTVAGLSLLLKMPGAVYLFLVPALVAAVEALLTRRPSVAAPVFVAGLLWSPLVLELYGALGHPALLAVGAALGLILSTFAAIFCGVGDRSLWRGALAAAILAIGAAGLLVFLPHATAERPERANLIAFQLDDTARLLAFPESNQLPDELADGAEWQRNQEPPFPWSRRVSGWSTSLVERDALPLVEKLEERVDADGRWVKLRFVSQRNAPIQSLQVPEAAELKEVRVNGVAPPVEEGSATRQGWRSVTIVAGPAAGSIVELLLGNPGEVEIYALDRQRFLPPSAAKIAARRPPRAVPSGTADGWVVATRFRF